VLQGRPYRFVQFRMWPGMHFFCIPPCWTVRTSTLIRKCG